MTQTFAPGPRRHIPDATVVQQLARLLAEAGELRDRIASACAGSTRPRSCVQVSQDASTPKLQLPK
jgi:hypothetical protein